MSKNNTINDAVKKRIKERIESNRQAFINSSYRIDFDEEKSLTHGIVYRGDSGADFSESEVTTLLLEQLSSFEKCIDHISQDYITLPDKEKVDTLSNLTSLSLMNLEYLYYNAPSDMNFSAHKSLIKNILAFCDTTTCNLLDSDTVQADELSLIFTFMSRFISMVSLFPLPQLSQRLQQEPNLLHDIAIKLSQDTMLKNDAEEIEDQYKKVQANQYLTHFTPNQGDNYYINGEPYNSYPDIRDHLNRSDKNCTCSISGIYTDISNGKVTEEETTINTKNPEVLKHIAFKFLIQYTSPKALLDSKTESLRFPSTELEEIFFGIIFQGKQEKYDAAVKATEQEKKFNLFPSI